MGLVIQRIEPNGRIAGDGKLRTGDRIVQINHAPLIGVDFVACQEILRDAMTRDDDLLMRVVREHGDGDDDERALASSSASEADERDDQADSDAARTDDEALYSIKASSSPSPHYSSASKTNLNALNTKKMGKRISVQLTKGPQGLGFKLASRDNPTGESSPIYIKSILPKGAAITDGRLQRGDRLLEVNGMDMTARSLHEAVNVLRNTRLGSLVEIVVSRQVSPSSLPRELPPDEQLKADYEAVSVHRELLTFEIALNDTGSAGLGVSVKGKTKRHEGDEVTSIDLGIFVKTVINGGAASKDGRLRPNDQLININGFSLLGKSNEEAMQILREAMQVETRPGFIQLTVSRKLKPARNLNVSENNADAEVRRINHGEAGDNGDAVHSNANLAEFADEMHTSQTAKRAFARDAPARRSMSEKRKIFNDANGGSNRHLSDLYTRIKINKLNASEAKERGTGTNFLIVVFLTI